MASSSITGPRLPLLQSEITLECLEEKVVEACLRTPEAKKVRKAEVADANACLEHLRDFSYGVTYRQYMGLEVGGDLQALAVLRGVGCCRAACGAGQAAATAL